MAENPNSFQEEIKELEAKLEAKKREMAATGIEGAEAHIFKTVVREHSGYEAPSTPANSPAVTTPIPQSTTTLTPADEHKIDLLVEHAFTKGITSAINEARRMNIPFLIDMLHDRLADEYYQKLLEARKLNTE